MAAAKVVLVTKPFKPGRVAASSIVFRIDDGPKEERGVHTITAIGSQVSRVVAKRLLKRYPEQVKVKT